MKKLFISLVAIAAAVFATSCTNDIEGGIKFNGKTATVGFEVSTPELATRTFGDGKSATDLYYGVYDEAGVLLPEISVINEPAEINIKTTVNLELVTGDSYTIVFWAENEGSAAEIVWADKTMTFDPQTASKEEYDAFYGKIDFKVEGPATLKADLYRPFAQVNIGTADFEKARKAGMEVREVKLTVKSAKTLNLFDGTVENEKTYTYDYAGLPTTEKFPVAGYDYMTMNYVLVAQDKHLVDVTMEYTNTEGKEYKVVYGNVPVQRNYRTNIYGNLLTDQTGVIVEIKPAFEDDKEGVDAYIRPWDGTMEQPAIDGNTVYIATGEQLAFFANAVNTNATFDNTLTRAEVEYAKANVVLTHDIDLNNKAWTPIVFNKGGKFDGQGHTIKNLYVNVESATGSAGLFDSAKYVKDVILENVNVNGHYRTGALVGNGLCARIENCHVKDGTVTSTVVGKDNANHVGGIVGYLSAENEAYAKGCSVENVTVKGYRDVGGIAGTANASGSNVVVVEKNTVKDVTVIADQTVEYVEYKAANAGAVVGRNNRGIDLSNNYTENVEVKVLANANSLAGILTSNAKNIEVTLAENVDLPISSLGQITGGSGEYKLGGVDTETITIDLNGKTLNITTTYWSNLGAKNENALFTIKNGTMTSSQATGTWNSYDLTFSNCDYAFEDVVFEKAVAFANAGKKVSMKDVTINETHDYYAMWITAEGQTVNVEGLTINSLGRGIKIDEQYVDTPAKVTLNVKDSKIKSEKKAAIVVKSVEGAEINVEDLDITAAAADTKFAVWVDEDAADYAEKVVVNGAYCKVEGSADAVASTETELKAALENGGGGTVILDSDFTIDQSLSNGYGKTGINMTKGGTLDGNGNELGAPKSTGTWDSAINTSGGTIKNIKITKGFRGIFIKIDENHNEKLYLDNVTIDGTTYTISCDKGNGLGLEASNSTFKGWTSFAGTLGDAKFVDCYFGYGNGYSFCRPYAPTEFVGCEFEKGFRIDPRANISFENCTLNGVAITAENVATLVSDVAKVTIK